MSNIHIIMVAIDFSKYSLPTAQYATQLAQDLGAELLFVNVINQRDIDAIQSIAGTYSAFEADQVISERVRERHASLLELIESCNIDPSKSRGIVRMGVPYMKLLDVIKEEAPDLLVIATKGRSDVVDVVMGSCARSMYRRSPIPLLSIRGDKFFK